MDSIAINEAKKYIMSNIKLQLRDISLKKPSSICFISGPPGCGKSDMMVQIAKENELALNCQYLSTMNPEKFGLPLPTLEKDAEFQKWSKPEFYSEKNLIHSEFKENGVILFMDDLHLAQKTIQRYLFQLLTNRAIHNKVLPEKFIMVAAGNRGSDNAGAQPILAPVVNRFYFLDVTSSAADWLNNYAIPKNLRQDVISFMEYYPSYLSSEPLESTPWASPRSWTYLSNMIDQFESEHTQITTSDILVMASGHIGLDFATKFEEFRSMYLKWDVDGMLNGEKLPDVANLSKIDCYTLTSSLMGGLFKNLRAYEFDITNGCIIYQINVVKTLITKLIDVAIEIIPMALRTLIVTEGKNEKAAGAKIYYQIIKGNDKLMEATKNLLGKS